jgi:hypothetical protein
MALIAVISSRNKSARFAAILCRYDVLWAKISMAVKNPSHAGPKMLVEG